MAQDEVSYAKHLINLDKLGGGQLGIKILGITLNSNGTPSIVTKMNFIEGRKPKPDELYKLMIAKYGFEDAGFNAFRHKDSGVTLTDCHAGNFILTPDGELVPIDVHLDGDIDKPMFMPKKGKK